MQTAGQLLFQIEEDVELLTFGIRKKIAHNPSPRILNLLVDMGSTNKGLLIQRLIIFLGKPIAS
jgi:hypothetical protein